MSYLQFPARRHHFQTIGEYLFKVSTLKPNKDFDGFFKLLKKIHLSSASIGLDVINCMEHLKKNLMFFVAKQTYPPLSHRQT